MLMIFKNDSLDEQNPIYPLNSFGSDKLLADLEASENADLKKVLGDGTLILTKQEFTDCEDDFKTKYKNLDGDDFAKPITVKWGSLVVKVEESGININKLVLYCMHRYDIALKSWFLTIEFCELVGFTSIPNVATEYPVAHKGKFIDICADGKLRETDVTLLASEIGNLYGPEYMENVTYSPLGTIFEPLKKGNIRATVVPWFELRAMYAHNIAGGDSQKFELCFTSITSDFLGSEMSFVQYPHSIAIHSIYDNVPKLDDNDIIITGAYFKNKAGDYQTLCPPRCQSYVWPNGLHGMNEYFQLIGIPAI